MRPARTYSLSPADAHARAHTQAVAVAHSEAAWAALALHSSHDNRNARVAIATAVLNYAVLYHVSGVAKQGVSDPTLQCLSALSQLLASETDPEVCERLHLATPFSTPTARTRACLFFFSPALCAQLSSSWPARQTPGYASAFLRLATFSFHGIGLARSLFCILLFCDGCAWSRVGS